MTPAPPDPTLPARLRAFQERMLLASDSWTSLLSQSDDRILYLAAILRYSPVPAPALSPEECREFIDRFTPHGVYQLLAPCLGAWPNVCRPPAEVMNVLKRQPSTRPRLQRAS